MYKNITFLARGVKWGCLAAREEAEAFCDKAERASPPNPMAQDWSIERRESGVENLLQCMAGN